MADTLNSWRSITGVRSEGTEAEVENQHKPVYFQGESPTLLPEKIARFISASSRGVTFSIRVGTYIAETAIDTSRVSTLTALGVSKKIVERLIAKADADTPHGTSWAVSGIETVNETAALLYFITSLSFHLMSSAVSFFSGYTQGVVHIINAAFGSTDSSRAITSIAMMIRRELGDDVGLYALFTALAIFSVLQSRGWRRTLESIEEHVLWDVVVSETGKQLIQQLPIEYAHKDYEERRIMHRIPRGTEYKITVDEISNKTITVDLLSENNLHLALPSMIPSGATILSEESHLIPSGKDSIRSSYKLMFERNQHRFKKRTGMVPGMHDLDSTQSNLAGISPLCRITGNPSCGQISDLDRFCDDGDQDQYPRDINNQDPIMPHIAQGFGKVPYRQPHEFSHKSSTSSLRIERSPSITTLRSVTSESSLKVGQTSHVGSKLVPPFPSKHITHSMARYVRFASASYGYSFMALTGINIGAGFPSAIGTSTHRSQHYVFANHTGLALDDIILSSYSDSVADDKSGIALVHFVAVDHEAKAVVLTIRGTMGLEDMLTDLTCEYETFQWQDKTWKAHGGMLKCAQLLTRSSSCVLQTIRAALDRWGEPYGLIICGHSLGAGVAAILGILVSEPTGEGYFVTESSFLPPGRPIRCFCYGPPASISSALRLITKPLIVSVVYGLDIVPSLSLGLLRDFQSVAKSIKSEKKGAIDDLKQRILRQFSGKQDPLTHYYDENDDYLWSILKTLRAVMQNEKLVPPGEVYHITSTTVYESHHGRPKRAQRVVGSIIVDVDKRFGEPVFGREIFHHSPLYYERTLKSLQQGLSGAPF